MKTNELTSKDLMIEDWLQDSFGNIGQVYRLDTGRVHLRLLQERPQDEEYIVHDIEPIPLTPEILEKNGFGCDRNDGYAILRLEDNSELLYYFHEYKLTKFYKSEIIFRCQCVYAHELQHALKLCGIDKEIVV